jgi:dTDP-4-amino-4,6-dideoxygalactose transaminase
MSENLALLGGAAAVKRPGPHYFWPPVTDRTERAIIQQLREAPAIYGRYSVFERFEDRWSQYHARQHSLVVNSGTNALLSMFVGANLKGGDEVICPAYTFFATCAPLYFTGATPVLCDCDETGNIDPAKVKALVTERTKAVVITHMWGIPCRMDELVSICKKHDLLLLEDASHAHGATYRGRPAGSFGDAAAWSLGGQKIITGGEGGVLSTDRAEIHSRALLLGHYHKRCFKEIPPDDPLHRYAATGMGLKLRASPMNIAMANEQFDHLDDWLVQKRAFAKLMTEALSGLPGITLPKAPPDAEPSWYSFVLQYHAEKLGGLPIERFHKALVAEGCVETNLPTSTCPLNWLPLFQEPAGLFPQYAGTPRYSRGQFPVAERYANKAITVPVWAHADDEEVVMQYIAAIRKVVENHKQLL